MEKIYGFLTSFFGIIYDFFWSKWWKAKTKRQKKEYERELVIGTPLAFYVIKKIINLIEKQK